MIEDNSLFDWLLQIDTELFILLNIQLQNHLLNVAMPFITEIKNWRLVLAVGWLLLMIFGGKKGRMVGLALVLVVTLSDQASSSLIKPLVRRIRPCHVIENVHLLVRCSRAFAFPSSHAANLFAAATFITLNYRRVWLIFYFLAVLVGYSRIYVGVHYPLDVLGGAGVGVLCAFVMFGLVHLRYISIWNRFKRPWNRPKEIDRAPE